MGKKPGIIQIPDTRATTDRPSCREFTMADRWGRRMSWLVSLAPSYILTLSPSAMVLSMPKPKLPPSAPVADLGLESLQVRREAIFLVIAQVPEGHVITYGDVARLAGLGRGARLVGRILSQLPEDTRLPWHRVIAAGGRISLPLGSVSGNEQRARLRAEGVRIHNDRVDIRRHGWPSGEQS